MFIRKMIIHNFKSLKNANIAFNPNLNIIVGDNETGKTTLLEAINLVVSNQMNNRNINYELSPYIFNYEVVAEYILSIKSGHPIPPPSIVIEAYLEPLAEFARFEGSNNTLKENCPGLRLIIEFDEEFIDEYTQLLSNTEEIRTVPVEFYSVKWYSFANKLLTARSAPLSISFIDNSTYKTNSNADRYLSKIINNVLERKQKVDLSLLFRKLKEVFQDFDGVKKINSFLETKKGDISEKTLSVSMDVSSNSSWETNLIPHLDGIPIFYAGQGEQSCVNIKLAMESSNDSHIFLVEEPENHLSFPNMNKLISKIKEKGKDKQIFITTHSSFVLNKLGINNVMLLNNGKAITLNDLSPDTKEYFMKLPGHDTLRMILSRKPILVEGPSDELIVQKAFFDLFGILPLEKGVDVISVGALAFKRFLEIARLLELEIAVVTDNDGDTDRLVDKYKDFTGIKNIKLCFSPEKDYPTLEPQLLHFNSLDILNIILETKFENVEDILHFMKNNKTDCALKVFNTKQKITMPEYILNAIK